MSRLFLRGWRLALALVLTAACQKVDRTTSQTPGKDPGTDALPVVVTPGGI